MTLKRIQNSLVHKTTQAAQASERKRMNHNFHQPEDVLQRFLNAVEPDSYICPHRHSDPPMPEVMILLQGKAGIVTFDDNGNINDTMLLDPTQGFFGVDIPPDVYHTLFSLQKGSVFFEVKQGPYDPKIAKQFAPWAPREGESGAEVYLQNLIKEFYQRVQ